MFYGVSLKLGMASTPGTLSQSEQEGCHWFCSQGPGGEEGGHPLGKERNGNVNLGSVRIGL